MNYYEHHLGDWAAATGHLTWDEDMAYTRLLRAYYHHEQAIAEGQQYRLAKASTPAQRRAVDQVLLEFFELRDGRYHQKRADAEIARFQDKQAKARRSAEARWNAGKPQTDGNANASADGMRTHSDGNALQTPDTRHQTPVINSKEIQGRATSQADGALPQAPKPEPATPSEPPPSAPVTPGAAACMAMKRQAGFTGCNSSDPRLLALLAAGVTIDELVAVASEAIEKRKGWPWMVATIEGRRRDAAAMQVAPAPTVRQADPLAWTKDRQEVISRAMNAGMQPWNAADAATQRGPNWAAYLAEVIRRTSDTEAV